MWTIFLSCREAREFWLFYLKSIALVIIIFHSLFTQSKGHELGNGKGLFCRIDDDCDKSRFLVCTGEGSTCDCHRFSKWISDENSCMLMEDAPCERKVNEPKCVTNSSCIAEKCDCDNGYLRNGFGICELGYGEVCSESEKCAARYSLVCSESGKQKIRKCQCRNEGKELVWDDNKRKCVSTAGSSCDKPGSPLYGKDDQLECIDNAECGGTGFCECKSGFHQTPEEGTCMLGFGEPCDAQVCDKYQFLLCHDGKCDCEFQNQMKYDENFKQCRALAGENCPVESEHTNGADDNDTNLLLQLKCFGDSYCKPGPGGRRGTCTCLQGMEKQTDGTCSRYNKGHGFSCSTSIDCDKKKFLECELDENEGGRCECLKNDMYFDGKDCRVLPGRSCTQNKLCANNSYCDTEWCVCNEGYKIGTIDCIPTALTNRQNSSPNQDHFSVKSAEETECDLSQGIIERTRCHCQLKSFSHKWIPEKSRCLALVGTSCLRDSDCIPNAICDIDEKMCQCSVEARTTKDRTCILSGNSKHSVDSHTRECTEIHTLKSVRSEEELYRSGGAKAASYIISIIFVCFLVAIRLCDACIADLGYAV